VRPDAPDRPTNSPHPSLLRSIAPSSASINFGHRDSLVCQPRETKNLI
jgi:hypothetical protein